MRRSIQVLVTTLILALAVLPAHSADSPWEEHLANNTSKSAVKMLFIGHSKLYINNMPKMFSYIVQQRAAGQPIKIYSVMGDAYTLADHWKRGMATRAIRNEGPWDYVVLIERSNLPETNPTLYDQCLRLFSAECVRAHARMVLVENYADNVADYPKTHQTMNAFAARYRAYLLPVGTAWNMVRKNHPSIQLFQSDGHHPATTGTYLMSCVCYSCFLGRHATELPRFLYSVDNEENTKNIFESESDAAAIQQCADDAVNALRK